MTPVTKTASAGADAPAPTPTPTPTPAGSALPDVRVAPILVVDDEPSVRQLLVRGLHRAGLASIEAHDGARALEILATETVSLVLLDLQLPDLSGLDVLERVRANPDTATLPVIMVTASDITSARVAGLEAGADDYVGKPVDVSELVARVRAHLRRQDAWQATARLLRRQATLIEEIASLPRAPSAEEMADGVCALLAREVDDVAIVAFTMSGAPVLGARGALALALRPGAELDPVSADGLRELCRRGAWYGPNERRVLSVELALAPSGIPLAIDGMLAGALLVGSSTQSSDATSVLLGAGAGLGAIIAALLVPGLAQRNADERTQADFARIVDSDDYTAHFQPIVELATDQVVGYEALTRWADGAAPDCRLATARAVGFAHELERAMVTKALDGARALPAGRWVSINMSPEFVLNEPDIGDLLSAAGRPVVIELTEHEAVEDYDALRAALARAGEHTRLAIDDAGAGYASLRHILALDPSLVKLDISWIRGIDTDPARQALVSGLQHFAAQTGRSLIAEGIETREERDAVQRLGISYGQGYFHGRASAVESLER